jgi:hypothetical protein
MCEHDWQPIPNWYARYRCTLCNAVGAKFGVVQGKHCKRSNEIQPYRCVARCGGVKCERPAVHSVHGKKFRCAEHRRPVRSARARNELAPASADVAVTPGEQTPGRELPSVSKGS